MTPSAEEFRSFERTAQGAALWALRPAAAGGSAAVAGSAAAAAQLADPGARREVQVGTLGVQKMFRVSSFFWMLRRPT